MKQIIFAIIATLTIATSCGSDTGTANSPEEQETQDLIAAVAKNWEGSAVSESKAKCAATLFVEQHGVEALNEAGVTVDSPQLEVDADDEDVNPLFIDQSKALIAC